jgi:hypothetical protein
MDASTVALRSNVSDLKQIWRHLRVLKSKLQILATKPELLTYAYISQHLQVSKWNKIP